MHLHHNDGYCKCSNLCPPLMPSCCVNQMPADVFSITAEEQPGENSLERWGCMGVEGQSRHLPDSLERPSPLSHLPLLDVRGDDAGPYGHRLDGQSGLTFSYPDVTQRPLQYGKALYLHISNPPGFSCKQGQR
ncbi:hypothetical protein AMECASPLE_016074 [Ameca splendens]|uniref:Uncharacterized protein n=1 Tax=Ameca splendens TaxID=208324 RepID=A0ABV0YP86_9TELE